MAVRKPMKLQRFHILLALAEQDLHGFGIQRAVLDRTGGELRLWPATLYRSLSTLCAEGLIEPTDTPDGDPPDERRAYYSLTSKGRRRLESEAERLAGWVDATRSALTRS